MQRKAIKLFSYARSDVARREPVAPIPNSDLLGRDAPLTLLWTATPLTSLTLLSSVLVVVHALCFVATAQTGVQDIFGRSLNQRGITLVDWEGYLCSLARTT